MKKAFLYLQLPPRAGGLDASAISRTSILEYARRSGIDLVCEFSDVEANTSLQKRTGLGALIYAVNNSHVDFVLVNKLDHLASDTLHQESIIAYLGRRGVQVLEVHGDAEATLDLSREAARQMAMALTEVEKSFMLMNLKAGREAKKAETGRCEGAKPFGHYVGEQEVMNRIRELRRKRPNRPRLGARLIARQLEAEGYRSRKGKPWTEHMVASVLKSPLYISPKTRNSQPDAAGRSSNQARRETPQISSSIQHPEP